MKVGELLSGPTLTSSRTLTVYAATLLVVLFTDTNPKNLPLLSGLNVDQSNVYWLLATLLFFLSVVHVVNWSNDVVSEKKSNLADAHAVHLRKKSAVQNSTKYLDDSAGVEPPSSRRELFEQGKVTEADYPSIFNAIRTEAAERRSKQLNNTIQFGLHIGVPMTLAALACILLIWKIYSLISIAN